MVAGSVLGVAVQKVPGPLLAFLPVALTPVMVQRRLLSEPNLPRQRREGVGPLREARQTLGSTADQSPPKRKNSSGWIPRWLLQELIAFP